jgi:transcriptional regulator with XRE-family HTH domain
MKFYSSIFKMFRESKRYTLEDVGKLVNVSKQTVQKWEAGKVTPRPEKIYRIAELFGCSVQDISDLKPEGWLIDHYEKLEQESDSIVESFRSALIAEIIMLEIDPIAKDTVLKKIQTFKQGE